MDFSQILPWCFPDFSRTFSGVFSFLENSRFFSDDFYDKKKQILGRKPGNHEWADLGITSETAARDGSHGGGFGWIGGRYEKPECNAFQRKLKDSKWSRAAGGPNLVQIRFGANVKKSKAKEFNFYWKWTIPGGAVRRADGF